MHQAVVDANSYIAWLAERVTVIGSANGSSTLPGCKDQREKRKIQQVGFRQVLVATVVVKPPQAALDIFPRPILD